MQLGNQFCYQSAIGRVLTYFIIGRVPIPYYHEKRRVIALYYFNLKMSRPLCIPKSKYTKKNPPIFVRSGLNLYIYFLGSGGDFWLLHKDIHIDN